MNGTKIGSISRFTNITPVQTILFTGSISLLINIAVLVDYLRSPFSHFLLWDAANYWKWALDIAAGSWLGDTVFHQAPLYPYVLGAFITIFGEHLVPIYLFQCIIAAATSALVCSIAIKAGNDHRAGLVTGLMYAFYGMQVFYATKILSECISAFLLVFTVRLIMSKTSKATVAAGTMLGMALLAKPHFLMAVPLLALYIFIRLRRESVRSVIRHGLYFLCPLMLIVLTVTARNYFVGREPVLISSNGGENFYIGANEKANGAYVPIEGISSDIAFQRTDVIAKARSESGRKLTQAGASHYWFTKGVKFAVANPGRYLALELTKLLNFFSGAERSNMYMLQFEKRNLTRLFALPFIGFYLLLPLFLVGMITIRQQWSVYYPVYAVLAVNLLVILIFFYDTRYMVAAMPFFILICGAGLWSIATRIRSTETIRQGVLQPATIMLLCGIGVTLSVFLRDRKIPQQDWRLWMSLGDIHYGLGKFDQSIDYYIKASELNKYNCMPVFGASKALFRRGNREEAAHLYASTFKTAGADDRTTIRRDRDFDAVRKFINGLDSP